MYKTANTIHKGSIRSMIFEENGEWFGVALEFNIVETGSSPQEVMLLLDEAVKGYVEAAQKSKLPNSVLNQEVDPEYELLWNENVGKSRQRTKKAKSKKVYSTSTQFLAGLAMA